MHIGLRWPRTAGLAVLALTLIAGCAGAAAPAPAPAPAPAAARPAWFWAGARGPRPARAAPAAAPVAAPVLQVASSAKLGSILVDGKGMAVYRYAQDSKDMSACADACLKKWPAVVAAAELKAGPGVTGSLGKIKRADGVEQVTINGMPLYTYAADEKPGDVTGQGVGNNWFALAPDGSDAKAPAAADKSTDYGY